MRLPTRSHPRHAIAPASRDTRSRGPRVHMWPNVTTRLQGRALATVRRHPLRAFADDSHVTTQPQHINKRWRGAATQWKVRIVHSTRFSAAHPASRRPPWHRSTHPVASQHPPHDIAAPTPWPQCRKARVAPPCYVRPSTPAARGEHPGERGGAEGEGGEGKAEATEEPVTGCSSTVCN